MMAQCYLRFLVILTAIFSVVTYSTVISAQEEAPAKQEEKEGPKSSKEALGVFAEAASYQNNEQFDLAASEWEKFVKQHNDDPKIDEARYHLAVCQIQASSFEDAISNLEQVITKVDDKFERIQDAYLNLGWSQYSMALRNQPELFAKAADTFAALLKKFPESSFRDQALFFGGESLYLQGKREEAVASYGELVEKHKSSDLYSDAMYALGVTNEELQHYKEAGAVFDQFLKAFPAHDLVTEVKMRKAETVLQAGEFQQAEKLFQEVAATDGFPSADHARYRQAFCIAEQGRFSEAAAIFGAISEEMSESAYASDATIAAGRAYYRAKDFDQAVKWFSKLESSDSPHAPEAAHWHARIMLDRKQPNEARELVASVMPAAQTHRFLVSLKLDDADALYEVEATRKQSVEAYLKIAQDHQDHQLAPKATYNAAYGAMELGEYRNGLAHAQEFFAKYKDHSLGPEVQKVVAECKLQLGELGDAAKEFADLAKNDDGTEGTRFQIRSGLSLFLKKEFDGAIEILRAVAPKATDPDEKAEAFYWLGRSYGAKDEHENAISAYEAARAANPKWRQADEVVLNLARSLRSANRTPEAKTTVAEMISSYPNSGVLDQAYYRLAEFCYATADYPGALSGYGQVIKDWPQSQLYPFSLYGRGWSLLRHGDPKNAQVDFANLLKDFPDHELANQTIYAKAMAQHQAGSHQEALQAVTAFLETNPSTSAKSDAIYLEGLCHSGLKNSAEAVKKFQELLKQDPNYASADKVRYEMAWIYKNAKDEAASVKLFQEMVKASPDSALAPEAQYHVGESFYADKQYEEAAREYMAAQGAAKTDDLLEKARYKLGWSHYQLRNYDQALAAFDQQLEVTGDGNLASDARFMRGECFFKMKKFKESLDAYINAKDSPSKNETMQVLTYLHAGQSASQLEDWKASEDWTTELVQRFPESPYLPQARYELGWAQRNLGQLDPALQQFNEVVKTSRNELGARARFMAGEVLFEKKAYNEAILEFRKVMFGYGADKAPPSIKQWQAKAAFEAGRCASILAGTTQDPQRRQELVNGAGGFFRYVAEKHAQSDEAAAAKQQLERLGAGPSAARSAVRPGTAR